MFYVRKVTKKVEPYDFGPPVILSLMALKWKDGGGLSKTILIFNLYEIEQSEKYSQEVLITQLNKSKERMSHADFLALFLNSKKLGSFDVIFTFKNQAAFLIVIKNFAKWFARFSSFHTSKFPQILKSTISIPQNPNTHVCQNVLSGNTNGTW